ncbi:hypothetical protein M3P05_03755 [Sansalvadorimonas sp. 2012CJ34-2]|uniref:Uncharacterized protein n=1 Tax=Parendozoicomonas callyspongiae TaxID=2942213 RepID=A0ABT0PCV9_9GAMM|nr:hypothetical protein [Sansalvadorimonas sp. 2012CJ34-2]MCL6269056.1 hypothetical protein [Sansalvadorimonas sp. 2012CJ34-2]
MTPENDSAEKLLQDLENLHKFLGKNDNQEYSTATNEIELPEDGLEFDLGEDIPVLADQVVLEEKTQPELTASIDEQPLTNDEISLIIDTLVAEYLPEIEQKLRKQLLRALTI